MNQRQATVSTLLAVLEERGVEYELNGETPISEVLTSADKKSTQDALVAMFRSEQIDMNQESKAKYAGDKELRGYVSGLINNWVRKAPEFNGGEKYTAKNPGSRTGSGDEQIKEMRKLLGVTQDSVAKQAIQSAIDARLEELKPETTINLDNLPESLKAKLGL